MTNTMAAPLQVGVLGLGRLGKGWLQLFQKHAETAAPLPYTVRALFSRHPKPPKTIPIFKWPIAQDQAEVLRSLDALFLCVPDDALEQVLKNLTAFELPNLTIVHHSGLYRCTELIGSHRWRGFGCLHPLCALPNPDIAAQRLARCHFTIESPEPQTLQLLQRFATDLSGSVTPISAEHKALYHAVAVMVSSLTLGQIEKRIQILGQPELRTPLLDLCIGALSAARDTPTHAALTGPLVRDDLGTVQRHIHALQQTPHLEGYLRESLDVLDLLSSHLERASESMRTQLHQALRAL